MVVSLQLTNWALWMQRKNRFVKRVDNKRPKRVKAAKAEKGRRLKVTLSTEPLMMHFTHYRKSLAKSALLRKPPQTFATTSQAFRQKKNMNGEKILMNSKQYAFSSMKSTKIARHIKTFWGSNAFASFPKRRSVLQKLLGHLQLVTISTLLSRSNCKSVILSKIVYLVTLEFFPNWIGESVG